MAELTGKVIYAGEAGYADARLNFNTRFAASPLAIVFCQSVQDVVNAVNWAQMSGVPVRVRGGRHSYEAFSVADDALIIDLNDMEQIRFDRTTGQVTIQAGAELVPIYETLAAEGVTIPGGSCATVGITGLTLGGGYGLLARWKGLTCDSLQSVEMVTAVGKLIVASATQNSDLFWALRGGGGGNFGIVTALKFQTHAIDKVTVYQLKWDASEIERVIQQWQAFAPESDDRHTSILKLTPGSSVYVVGQFVGTEAELRNVLAPLFSIAPKESSFETLPYLGAIYAFAGLKPDYPKRLAHWHGSQTKFKNASDYVARPLDAKGIATIVQFLRQAPSQNVVLQFDSYGGAIAKIPSGATAFFHRQVKWNIQYQAYWTKTQEQAAHINWVQNFRSAMQPYVTGGCYVNYCDRSIKNWQTAYYGSNWQRLKQVKQQYDPGNFFSFEQSISAYPGDRGLA
ncbi:FAD-binding oxidoreductase [Leptolyngbya sp. DQ-M1]|uniref:FAD-binding oxidoreductase n=1 Tax=Leptolyngbya sp. DQ-M1 TaxID=2933920 RepID=UPI003296D445